jgi:YidC/Oxa1 family membrane protein insertase
MQELQPKIKDLQRKYGKDRQRISQETMRLYSEHGVNPAAGCLPMLAQMPIFFALYFAIRELSNKAEGHFADGFLWIQDLGEPDRWELMFIPIVPLAILAGIFQFVQMRMTRPAGQGKVRDPQQAMMQSMMNFMPLMVVIFGWNFAAGVVLYWAAQSLYSVIQQWFITGWGSLKDWMPWLPEMPEHRRLGHQSAEKRKKKVVVSGEEDEHQMGGLFGWMQRKSAEIEKRQAERARERGETAPQGSQVKQVIDEEPEVVEADVANVEEEPEGVVTITASGGQVRRRGRRRRRTAREIQGGSGEEN